MRYHPLFRTKLQPNVNLYMRIFKRQTKIDKKTMYKKALGLTLTTIGLIILALGIYAYSFSTVTQNQTKTIDASDIHVAQLELELGDAVHSVLTILDGNEGIAIYVENHAQESVYDGGTVYTSLEFNFYVQTTGPYAVNFENLSPTNQQTIEYSLTHSTYSRTLSLAITIIGAILLIAGITTTFIASKKSRS